jgi:hypothetical protein
MSRSLHILASAAAVQLIVLMPIRLGATGGVKPEGVEVSTYLETQLPPGEGAPVCLTGATNAIGRVSSVEVLENHAQSHDAWKVVMDINNRDSPTIPTDSVVYAMSSEPGHSCGASSGPFFLEIDTRKSAWSCHSSSDCTASTTGSPIDKHLVLRGEVTYGAAIAWMKAPSADWEVYLFLAAVFLGSLGVAFVFFWPTLV